ncbi:hypothetical protein HQ590_01935 [bacterium]|nr:hypothetical protein [bacterium]
MSLINDALKRTREQSVSAGYAVAATPPARYQVAAERRPARRRVPVWGGGLAVALVLVVGLTALALYRLRGPAPEPALSPETDASAGAVSVAPTQPAAGPVAPVSAVTAELQASEERLVDRVVERLQQEPAGATLAAPAAAPALANPPPPPALVLQGVSRFNGVYEAMINGYPVRVGEEIEGARLVAIEGRVVRLTWQGEELVLRLR